MIKSIGGLLCRTAAYLFLCAATVVYGQRPPGLPGNYPAKPVRVLVGAPAGGGTDVLGRIVMAKLGERWNASFVLENVATLTGGIRAMDLTLQAPADGYTLLATSGSTFQNAMFTVKVPYDIRKVFVPILQMSYAPLYLAINPDVPAINMGEFVAYLKKNPGKLNMANPGTGTSGHLSAELLYYMTGTQMLNVPYKGVAPAVLDTIAGRTHAVFSSAPAVLGHVRSGKLRLLGTTAAQRSRAFPDMPAIAEFAPGFRYIGWDGLIGKEGLSQAIIAALNRDGLEVIKSPEIMSRFEKDGTDPALNTPEQFWTLAIEGLDRIEPLFKSSGLKLE